MVKPDIELGQILILAGGAAAWFGTMAVARARMEDVRRDLDAFKAEVKQDIKGLKDEFKTDLNRHGEALFTMSGQVQRVIGAMGSRVRATDAKIP